MKDNKWKTIGIVFIIISIIEFLFIVWAWNVGDEYIENRSNCMINICEDSDSFFYDEYSEICYCYKGEEVSHQKYLG